MKTTVEFFDAIYPEIGEQEYIELRVVGEKTTRAFFRTAADAAAAALKTASFGDVYFGVATRDGKGGKRANIVRVGALWADLDAKGEEVLTLARLRGSPVPPSMAVHSGRGIHVYWLLESPVPASRAEDVETVNKVIARRMGGDAVHDVTRVLRVPGTYNHKHDHPLDVALLGGKPDRRYSIEHLFLQFGKAGEQMPGPTSDIPSPTSEIWNRLPCRVAMRMGVDRGGRNNACFQLALDLKKAGLPFKRAAEIMSIWNARNRPPLEHQAVEAVTRNAYSTAYAGLGCDKPPMRDLCSADCPVRSRQPTGGAQPVPPEEEPGTITIAELLRSEIEPVRCVVDPLIPRGGLTLIVGEGGVGKSFMLIDLACCVASGEPFLGRFACEQGPVLTLDLENHLALITDRARKVLRAHGQDLANLERLPINYAKKNLNLLIDTERGRQWLREAVARLRPVLMVIDPLVGAHVSDESDNVAMRRVMMGLRSIAENGEVGIVIAHHPRKLGMHNDASQMLRGASDLRNAVDSYLYIRRVDRDRLIVDPNKLRAVSPMEKFEVRMRQDAANEGVRFDYVGETTPGAEKSAIARDVVLGAISEGAAVTKQELIGRVSAQGIGRATTTRVLSSLLSEGVIARPKHGVYELAPHSVVDI